MQYVTVIHAHGHPVNLIVAAMVTTSRGRTITQTSLTSKAPDYEAARAEAQAKYPGHQVLIPCLGELRRPIIVK